MTENISRQRQHGARVGSVSHELGGFARFEFTQLHFLRRIHSGIHEHNFVRPGNYLGVLGGKLLASERTNTGQFQGLNRLGYARTDPVIPTQSIAVANDKQSSGWHGGFVLNHVAKLRERIQHCQRGARAVAFEVAE